MASRYDRVGVFSFARYDPAFFGDKRNDDFPALMLERSCKILFHETCHMFGMQHCIFYRCVVNGTNHLEESDSQPLHLCPVCLHKLQWSVGFDVADRYRNLQKVHNRIGLKKEANWMTGRLKRISQDGK